MQPVHDTNNNAMEKSYSLRPRATTRKEDQEVDLEDTWKPRSRTRKKPKQKSMPLSKYRRKTANARERFRMREINEAFESLRRVIPHLSSSIPCENPCEKLTKISTLRLAMKYITALSNALQDPDFDSDADSFLSDWTSTSHDIRESSTPSSVNDYSDIYEQFFSPSSSESSTSPYNFSLPTSSPFSEISSASKFNVSRRISQNMYPPETLLPFNDSSKKNDCLTFSPDHVTTATVLQRCPAITSNSVPQSSHFEDDLNNHFLPSDFPTCTPSLLDELQDLSSPSVDLAEYLIT